MARNPDGLYHGHIKPYNEEGDWAVTSEAKSGSLTIEIKFEIVHYWDGSQWTPLPTPLERTLFLSLHDNALEYTTAKLKTLGFNGDFERPDFSDEAKTAGVDLNAETETDVNSGKERQRWDLARWGGTRNAEKASTDKLKRMNAIWKQQNGTPAKPAPSGKPSAPPAAPAPPPPPPAEEKGEGEPKTASSREEAWEIFYAESGGNANLDDWKKLLAAIGKPEAEFTAEDWAEVARKAQLPF